MLSQLLSIPSILNYGVHLDFLILGVLDLVVGKTYAGIGRSFFSAGTVYGKKTLHLKLTTI